MHKVSVPGQELRDEMDNVGLVLVDGVEVIVAILYVRELGYGFDVLQAEHGVNVVSALGNG